MKKMSLLICFIILITCTGCSTYQTKTEENVTIEDSGTLERLSNLNDKQKIIYDEFLRGIANKKTEFDFENVDINDIVVAYVAVYNNCPEYFWIGNGYSYETVTSGSNTKVSFKPTMDKIPSEQQVRFFNDTIDEIVKKINTLKDDFSKVVFIHDYIIDNTDYDFDTYDKLCVDNETMYDATTAYGCLCNKKAVCSGYSAAMQLLLNKSGISSGRVSGTKIGGGAHEWNYVMLEGEYYYIDVTWDDPQSNDSSKNKTYEFCCVTTDEIKDSHTIDDEQFVPDCHEIKYNYYVHNNMFLEKYSFEKYKELFKKDGAVKFGSVEETNKAVDDLIKNNRIYELTDSQMISYSTGVTGLVLMVKD